MFGNRVGPAGGGGASKPPKENVISPDLVADLLDYLERHMDVSDGSDGPRPNEAMSLYARLEAELGRKT